jgi:hypothetical protein
MDRFNIISIKIPEQSVGNIETIQKFTEKKKTKDLE